MTSSDLRKKFYDIIEDSTFDSARPYNDITEAAATVAAFAISRMPADEREHALQNIECGTLRHVAGLFPRPRYPKANGHAQPASPDDAG
jgi:hypothetical protein